MRQGSRHESGRRHSAETLRSSSGSGVGGVDVAAEDDGTSSWESMEDKEEEGCESCVHSFSWDNEDDEGWDEVKRSWESKAEESERH